MRKTWDRHFLNIAEEIASMGTCARRQVGCVLVDERHIILATGMNGVPPKWEHCRDNPEHACPGAGAKSGTNLDACLAIHAEMNALLHCPDVMRIETVYTTTSPCVSCVKALLCTGARRVVFIDEYTHPESKELWTRHGVFLPSRHTPVNWHRTWEQSRPYEETKVLGSSGLR